MTALIKNQKDKKIVKQRLRRKLKAIDNLILDCGASLSSHQEEMLEEINLVLLDEVSSLEDLQEYADLLVDLYDNVRETINTEDDESRRVHGLEYHGDYVFRVHS